MEHTRLDILANPLRKEMKKKQSQHKIAIFLFFAAAFIVHTRTRTHKTKGNKERIKREK